MAFDLRPYQIESRKSIHQEWESGRKKTLLVLPTGCGKTIVMAGIVQDQVDQGEKVLLLAHRGELLEQAQDKIQKVTGIHAAVEKAECTAAGSFDQVVVGSVQTLQSEKRLARFSKNEFQTILIDEAHHAPSISYRRILDYFSGAKVLGVTATADRADKKNLGTVFDSIAYEYSLHQAIKDGYLVPIKADMIPLDIDISDVGTSQGDFALGGLDKALEPYLDQIADHMVEKCRGRKTVVFLPLVSTSERFCEILNRKGMRAAQVSGVSKDRSEVLSDFDSGKYDVLCNSMLLTEGWDCPSVDCVIVLRATRSRGLYCQMIGRGTRLSPETGKKDLLVLDFLWHTEKHDLCRPAYLIAKNEELAARMQEKLENADRPSDLQDLEEESERDIVQEREAKLAEELAALRKRKSRLVDPLQFEMSLNDADLSSYQPIFMWEMEPPSEKQIQFLEKSGIDTERIQCKGYAKQLIDRLVKRRAAGYATPKQIKLLERYGFRNVGEWQFDDASSMIGRISSNRWRLPLGIDPDTFAPWQMPVSDPNWLTSDPW